MLGEGMRPMGTRMLSGMMKMFSSYTAEMAAKTLSILNFRVNNKMINFMLHEFHLNLKKKT